MAEELDIIPYTNSMIPPTSPMPIVFLSLSHCHTRYPPPISAIAATKNNPKVEMIKIRL